MNRIMLFLCAVIFLSFHLNGQVVENTKEKVKEKSKERLENKLDEGVDKTLDKVEEGIFGLFGSKKKDKSEDEDADENEMENKNIVSKDDKNKFQSFSKFDFIPGDEVIFYDDFADVAVGDFPMNWDTQASGEIVTISGAEGKWFKLKGDYSYFAPILNNFQFPENFTIEFDVIYQDGYSISLEIYEEPSNQISDGYYPGSGGTYMEFDPYRIIWKTWNNLVEETGREGDANNSELEPGEKIHYSIWGQKTRLRIYCNEEKVIDVPRGIKNELKMNFIRIGNYPEEWVYISNVRVAAGAPDTRSRLITEGKLVTRGITFDSGSDVIKSESYGVLKEIADVLKENKEVSVKIIGHTDSDGSDESNLTLSQKRAGAVKNMLVSEFGIQESRMTTDGKGESEPTSANTTAEGKANNRRVEFIKL